MVDFLVIEFGCGGRCMSVNVLPLQRSAALIFFRHGWGGIGKAVQSRSTVRLFILTWRYGKV